MNLLKLKLTSLLIIPTLHQKHTLCKGKEEHSPSIIVALLDLQLSVPLKG